MKITEDQIIEGCQQDDRRMQKLLYERYQKAMFAISMRYAKSDLEAEDILQEAFIKVFQNITAFRSDCTLGYWIKRIVINTALNHQRSKLYLYPMVDVDETHEKSDNDYTLADFQYKELVALLQELPGGCQMIFNLYAIEGYKHHEIAKMLNISVGTSKSQYARAKNLLKDRIEKMEGHLNGRYESSVLT